MHLLSGVRLGRKTIDLGELPPGSFLGLMGSPDSLHTVLDSIGALPDAAAPPRLPTGSRLGRQRVRSWIKNYLRSVHAEPGEAAWAEACSDFGVQASTVRMRLGDLAPLDAARLRLAAAWATGRTLLVLDDPFAAVPGHQRTGLRTRLADLVADSDRAVVFSSQTLTDFTLAEAGVADIEKDELVARGDLTQLLAEPRGSMPAELAGVNVYSGLARKGWLSIGHSAVRARTDLDGKVFVTLPWRAAMLSLDEHDPAFTSATVFEAIVTGLRDRGTCLQAKLSPVDTEMGLALDVDLADLAGIAAPEVASTTDAAPRPDPAAVENDAATAAPETARGFGVLHPGLGATISRLRASVRVGTHVWVEVDTSAMHAYSVE